jgi:hypothetical protein
MTGYRAASPYRMHHRTPFRRAAAACLLLTAPAVLACTHVVPAAASQAATAVAAALPDPVPAHDTFTVHSAALGEPRPINVYLPPQYRLAASATVRFPVLYMPDGGLDEDFPHVANTVDSLIALGVIRPVLVVGVPNTQRRRDLTGLTHVKSDSAIAPRVGGSAAFRRFLRAELMPEIASRYRDGGALVDSAAARLADYDGSVARTLDLSSSDEPSTAVGTARLAAILGQVSPPGLRWRYEPRPDLTHGNIFRTLAPEALAAALR